MTPEPLETPEEGPASSRGLWTAGRASRALARIIRVAALLVFALIVLAILLNLLKANPSNAIVSAVHNAAGTLVGPFANMFSFASARTTMVVNWGLAAIVYVIAGGLLASLVEIPGATGRPRTYG